MRMPVVDGDVGDVQAAADPCVAGIIGRGVQCCVQIRGGISTIPGAELRW